MNRCILAGLLPLLLLALSSCSVHQWPDGGTPAKLRLEFSFSTEMPPHVTVDYPTRGSSQSSSASTSSSGDEGCSFRYIVRFYPGLPDGTFVREGSSVRTFVFTRDVPENLRDDPETLGCTRDVELPEGRWEVRCWADWVRSGGDEDLYYLTSDFSSVSLPEEYAPGTDFKDAFVGSSAVDLVRVGSSETPVTARLGMARPLAKFRFVATDFDRLVSMALRERMSGEEYEEWVRSKSDVSGSGWNPSRAPGFEPSDYLVRFRYTSFLPSVFDMFSDRPVDSRAGVLFDSEFTPLSDSEALMGFDYVLVNGRESGVSVQVELLDRGTGSRLSLSQPITVPLKRGRLTTVRGDFLTRSSGGGIGIDPEFDGEYDIIIH